MTRVCLYAGSLKVLPAAYCVSSHVCVLSIAYLQMLIRARVFAPDWAVPICDPCCRQWMVIG